MNSYNNYKPSQRMAALRWFKQQIAKGLRDAVPISCDICKQTEGHLEFHSENYSHPYGDHIGQLGLCYVCHMMLHCRFNSPAKWQLYKTNLGNQIRYKAFKGRNWIKFKNSFLSGSGITAFVEPFEGDGLEVIDKIESGHYME
jgi:hypothetical protein